MSIYSSYGRIIIIFIACLVLFNLACSTKLEKNVKSLKKSIENSFTDYSKIIQNTKISKDQKLYKINLIQTRMDSLSKIWESNIEDSRTILSEKEIKTIEDENRVITEKLIRTVLKEMPEYKELLKDNFFNRL